MIMAGTVQTLGHSRVKPSVYFNPMAHPTSKNSGNNENSPIHLSSFPVPRKVSAKGRNHDLQGEIRCDR
jgi:hypothetical protein